MAQTPNGVLQKPLDAMKSSQMRWWFTWMKMWGCYLDKAQNWKVKWQRLDLESSFQMFQTWKWNIVKSKGDHPTTQNFKFQYISRATNFHTGAIELHICLFCKGQEMRYLGHWKRDYWNFTMIIKTLRLHNTLYYHKFKLGHLGSVEEYGVPIGIVFPNCIGLRFFSMMFVFTSNSISCHSLFIGPQILGFCL